jgi:Alginate export
LGGLSFAQGNAPSRPAYQNLRQNEDWSVMANPGEVQGKDFFDPIKYIPLTDSGSIWMSLGGQVRERVENWEGFNFGAPDTAVHDDTFLFSRMMWHADLHLGSAVRIFIQERSAFSTHRALAGGVKGNVDELDFENAFIDVKVPVSDNGRLTLRVGEQEIAFGKERFVGVSNWSNTRRTWDGFSGILDVGKSNLTFFWARPVRITKYHFNPPDSGTQFYGLDFNRKLPVPWGTLEMYWYGLNNRSATYDGTKGPENRHTFGARNVNQIGKSGFDYDLEGNLQVGSVGMHGIRAGSLVSQLGYTVRKTRSTPRFYLGYDYASGGHPSTGNVDTFNVLFPTSHDTLGYADIVGRENMFDLNGGMGITPARKWNVRLDSYSYWRASTSDALYDKRGAIVRAATLGSARKTGAEADLTVRYQIDIHTVIQIGYSHFFPGAFVRQSGPHEPVDFLYTFIQFTL